MASDEMISNAVKLGEELGHIFVATADSRGLPHLAAAGKIGLAAAGRVTVSAWFCPGTLANLQDNPFVSLVTWDPGTDQGHQLLGEVEDLEETVFMDGYAPQSPVTPQVERRMVVRIDKVLAFSHAPHTDREE